MLFDQNRVDAIIHYLKNQVFSNETIQGVPQRHSTCLKPPIGGFRNLASRTNKDKKINNSGTGLITLCKTNSLFIANGRMKSDIQGELTFEDKSCIDYFLLSGTIYLKGTRY